MRKLTLFFTLLGLVMIAAACGSESDASTENDAPVQIVENQDATLPPQTIIQENPTNNLAAEVNGQPITIEEVQAEIDFLEAGFTSEPANQDALISTALENRIDQSLIEQAAENLGIVVDEADVQAELTSLEEIATAQELSLEEFFAMQGIGTDQILVQIREALIIETVNQQVTANVPTTGPQVRARHILVSDEATALAILEQLNQGVEFADLALEYSLDPSTREAGGDLGWISPGDLLQAEVEAMVFSLPENARAPEPVISILGYHIIESIERAEDRPLDPPRIAEQRALAWEQWLDQQRATAVIVRYIGPNAQAN